MGMLTCQEKSKDQPESTDQKSEIENANVPIESRESPSNLELEECERACRRAQ